MLQVFELLTKGCNSLGYDFASDWIENEMSGMTILPVPLNNPSPSVWNKLSVDDNTAYTKGYPTANDTIPTVFSLVEAMLTMCSGNLKVDGNTVILEPNLDDVPSTSIINTLNVQSKRENEWRINTGEAWKLYTVNYLTDNSDSHTLDNFQQGWSEVQTIPSVSNDTDLVTIKGYVKQVLPFALGSRKDRIKPSRESTKEIRRSSRFNNCNFNIRIWWYIFGK